MDSKRKKCVYEYRKEKNKKLREESSSSCSKITSFLSQTSSKPSTQKDFPDEQNNVPPQSIETAEQILKTPELIINTPQPSEEIEPVHNSSDSTAVASRPQASELMMNNSELVITTHPPSENKTDFDLFKTPSQKDMHYFFSKHPVIPTAEDLHVNKLPFTKSIFSELKDTGEEINRLWLSYNSSKQSLYCTVCLAFTNGNSIFCKGFSDWKHIHQRISEHESSKSHGESVDSFMFFKKDTNIEHLLFNKHLRKRQAEVLEKRTVFMSIIEVVKLVGKQGIGIRNRLEAAYNLNDPTANHGNFLEILMLMAQKDETLSKHIKSVQEKSQNLREKRTKAGKKTYGRGNMITLFSKTTVMNIVNEIGLEIRNQIAKEVKQANIFSVMMDTTMDVSSFDQCSIVLRYVFNDEIHERVIGLKHVTSTTGEDLFNTLKQTLENVDLSLQNCIADAFDGASNMNGMYKGVSAKLKELNPNHIHTWCYAHVLNLVLTDTVQSLNVCVSFFGLLQKTQVFLKDSQKRFEIYPSQNPNVRLEAIGETRWRSRSNAAVKIFGHFHFWTDEKANTTTCKRLVFIQLVSALCVIANSNDFNPETRNNADSLLQKFSSFETILVAMMFLNIFQYTTPLSDYLQTKSLDYAQAWRLISKTEENLRSIRDKFEDVYKAAEAFATKMTEEIDKLTTEVPVLENVVLKTELPAMTTRKKKKMPGELAEDEVIESSKDRFKIMVFNRVVDQITTSMSDRFAKNQNLHLDLECFDPKRFTDLNLNTLTLKKVAQLVKNCDENKLKDELLSFSGAWTRIHPRNYLDEYNVEDVREAMEDSDVEDEKDYLDGFQHEIEEKKEITNLGEEIADTDMDRPEEKCSSKKICKSCVKCAYAVIKDYNMYSRQYSELYKVYKFLLTLPMTQVSCERSFSKLKIIKNRLRSRLTDDHLEALFLMNVERDKLVGIDNNVIMDNLCAKSSELRRILQHY